MKKKIIWISILRARDVHMSAQTNVHYSERYKKPLYRITDAKYTYILLVYNQFITQLYYEFILVFVT